MPAPTTTTSASRSTLTRPAVDAILGIACDIAGRVDDALAVFERRHAIGERGAGAVPREDGEHVVHGVDRGALQVGRDDDDLVAERLQAGHGHERRLAAL